MMPEYVRIRIETELGTDLWSQFVQDFFLNIKDYNIFQLITNDIDLIFLTFSLIEHVKNIQLNVKLVAA